MCREIKASRTADVWEGSELGFRDSNGDMKKVKNEDGGG